MLLAIFVLKERLKINRWLAVVISLLGTVVLLRPSLDFESNFFAYLCLVGAVIMGVEILCIKVLSEREPFLQILFINNLIATLIGVFPMILFFKIPNIIQLIQLVSIAGTMVLGQFFFLNAMKGTETTFIAPFFYSTLVFVMILDLVLFGVIPDVISLIGASLIILGGIFISLRINFRVFDWRNIATSLFRVPHLLHTPRTYYLQVDKLLSAYSSKEAGQFRDWLLEQGMGVNTVKKYF